MVRPARSRATGRGRLAILVLCLSALATGGCAFGEWRVDDPFDRELTLEESQHRYTVLVRWSDFERASKFVHEEERDGFVDGMPSFKKLRFTEYESEDPEIDEDAETATVEVTYSAYTMTSPIEISVVETQVWSREGVGNRWRVRSEFSGLEEALASTR